MEALPSRPPIRTAVVFVGGFTQRRDSGAEDNGMHDAYERVYRRFAGPQTLIEYYPWLVDPAEVAGVLARLNREALDAGSRLRIVLVGYSHGGYTVAEICRALAAAQTAVDVAILCDPVARWFGRIGWSRAMFPGTIRVTSNVRLLIWFRQHNRRFRWQPPFFFPSSHRVHLAGCGQFRQPPLLESEHVDCDNDPIFQGSIDFHVQRIVADSQHSPLTTHHSPTREAA